MPAALEYAPGRKFIQRKTFRRLGMVIVGAAMVACAARYADAIGRRGRLLYWQHQCLTYAPPADLVVYEEGPGAAARIASGQYLPWNAPLSDRPAAAFTPDRISHFIAEAVPTYPKVHGVPLFCHERQTPDGRRWLVIVSYWPDDCDGFSSEVNLSTRVVAPVWPLGGDHGLGLNFGMCPTYRHATGPRTMAIYAGQPDPQDASRFTIRYVRNGMPAVLYGHVEPIGEGGRFGNVRYTSSAYAAAGAK